MERVTPQEKAPQSLGYLSQGQIEEELFYDESHSAETARDRARDIWNGLIDDLWRVYPGTHVVVDRKQLVDLDTLEWLIISDQLPIDPATQEMVSDLNTCIERRRAFLVGVDNRGEVC